MPDSMFFDGWAGLVRVLAVGVPAYAFLILLLRVAGKRTLSKMNAFDFVVTIALGSTLATMLLSDRVPLAEGTTALALLVGLQYVIAWACSRSPRISAWVKSEPRILYHRGRFCPEAMRRERVTEPEILAAAREQGRASLEDVEAVILETEGELSFVPSAGAVPVLDRLRRN